MLRCPPSRINLAGADITAFEQRFAARQLAHLAATASPHVRLSPGPGRSTSLSLVPADQNIGRRRVDSSSSEATIHDGEDVSMTPVPDPTNEQRLSHVESVSNSLHHEILDEPPCHGPGLQLLSSARARRRYGRSKHELPAIIPDIEHTTTISSVTEFSTPVPRLVLFPENDSLLDNPALDPGAPVFVPRTRFAAGSAPRWSSVDSTHSAIDLRIRSSAERNSNVSVGIRQSARDTSGSSVDNVRIHLDFENVSGRQRQRSRTSEQSTGNINNLANLDRYPMFRPVSTTTGQRRSSRPQPHTGATSRARAISSTTLHIRQATGPHLTPTPTIIEIQGSIHGENTSSPSTSPPTLGDSRSTPNLMHHSSSPGGVNTRGSSLTWMRTCAPSTAIEADGNCIGGARVKVQSPRGGLDAAAEFLRMRNSPLDDLTEKLSRLSTSRAEPTTSSRRRASNMPQPSTLLTGNPFGGAESRPFGAADRGSHRIPESETFDMASKGISTSDEERTLEGLVALSLALPPSSSLPATPRAIIASPPCRHDSPMEPGGEGCLASIACGTTSTPPSCVKRKPVPTGCKTPKMAIYDDNKPPNAQPQTPADLHGRRSKARSDDTTTGSPFPVRSSRLTSPPAIPERRSRHRVENDLDGHLLGLEGDRQTWMGASGKLGH